MVAVLASTAVARWFCSRLRAGWVVQGHCPGQKLGESQCLLVAGRGVGDSRVLCSDCPVSKLEKTENLAMGCRDIAPIVHGA